MSLEYSHRLVATVKPETGVTEGLLSYFADVEDYMWCALSTPEGEDLVGGGFMPVNLIGYLDPEATGWVGWFRDINNNLIEKSALVFNSDLGSWQLYFPKH